MSAHADAAQLVLDALASGAVEVLDELHARDYVDHSPLPGQSTDVTGLRERAMELSSALVDTRVHTDVLVDYGDTVVCSTRTVGVHKGSFLGVAATDRRIEMTGLTVFRFVDGLITETWSSFEVLGMFDSLTSGPRISLANLVPAPRLASVASF
jgi:predicted ester cyclase